MSSTHTSYKLDEAQAIMSELRTIKKAICTGEKERRDLMHVSCLPAHVFYFKMFLIYLGITCYIVIVYITYRHI